MLQPVWKNPFGEFENKHVIVAGVGKDNIGSAIVEALHGLGAKVTVIDLYPTAARKLVARLGRSSSVKVYQANLAVEHERKKALKRAIIKNGPPGYFVSAIGLDQRVPFAELTQTKMNELNNANFVGPFFTAKELIPPMRDAGGGSILLFTSHHGDDISDPQMAGYSTAKAQLNKGIHHLAISAGIENTPDKIIRVNGFCPGWVWTPHQEARFNEQQRDAGIAEQAIPVKMMPEGLLVNVLMILSNKCSPYVTDTIFYADGGKRPQAAVTAVPVAPLIQK